MRNIVITLTLIMIAVAQPAQAHEEIERENLSLFVKEIDFLLTEIDRMKNLSRSGGRMIFDYTTLKNDLQSMRNGIRSYIKKDINDGRAIKPLEGKY